MRVLRTIWRGFWWLLEDVSPGPEAVRRAWWQGGR